MTVEWGAGCGNGKFIATVYGSDAEIANCSTSSFATGTFGITPGLDVYFYTEGSGWTKNGGDD